MNKKLKIILLLILIGELLIIPISIVDSYKHNIDFLESVIFGHIGLGVFAIIVIIANKIMNLIY